MGSKIPHILPSVQCMNHFRETIVRWYEKNGREYPWRKTSDPFKVLIAEIMLRRTKADQVKEVYTDLFKKYPDIQSIAEANQEELEQILYPLGLKWRNSAFQSVAREIIGKYDSKVPQTKEQLTTLPGVGNYVAGAVLSIGYGKTEWIVDANIVRLLKRYFAVGVSREGRRDKHIIEMAKMYVSYVDSRKANLAILDFAALVCIPSNPKCGECPLIERCNTANAK